MVVRKCKICRKKKRFQLFIKNTQNRRLYKDDEGGIWHGRVCYSCTKRKVRLSSGKEPLIMRACLTCQRRFQQKQITHRYCSPPCYQRRYR